MRERSGRQDVTERSDPNGLARRASAANATDESGGEAEPTAGSGLSGGAATRSLRSVSGAAHSAAVALRGWKGGSGEHQCRSGCGSDNGVDSQGT